MRGTHGFKVLPTFPTMGLPMTLEGTRDATASVCLFAMQNNPDDKGSALDGGEG